MSTSTVDTIFLDMDGVLVNFVQGIIDSHHLDASHEDWVSWDYHKDLGMTDEEFWSVTFECDWWRKLQPYPWMAELVKGLSALDAELIVCSTPHKESIACTTDKAWWLEDYVAPLLGKMPDVIFTQNKHLFAKPNVLLIDDSPSNVKKFRDAGGQAIPFKQPWNMLGLDHQRCLAYAKELVMNKFANSN